MEGQLVKRIERNLFVSNISIAESAAGDKVESWCIFAEVTKEIYGIGCKIVDLSAKFREDTGETLTDFILKEKTEEAKRLLRYSEKTATAIGAYLGFSSPGHFSRVFRKYAGCSPAEYRERYGK